MEKLPGPERYAILGNIPDLMCDDGIKEILFNLFSFLNIFIFRFQKGFLKKFANGVRGMGLSIIYLACICQP